MTYPDLKGKYRSRELRGATTNIIGPQKGSTILSNKITLKIFLKEKKKEKPPIKRKKVDYVAETLLKPLIDLFLKIGLLLQWVSSICKGPPRITRTLVSAFKLLKLIWLWRRFPSFENIINIWGFQVLQRKNKWVISSVVSYWTTHHIWVR